MTGITKPVDRETLYNEVWTEPVSVVAPRYGLSDVGLAKICHKLVIPLPSRGYWTKVKAGRIMRRAPLPKLNHSAQIATGLVKMLPEQAAIRETARKTAARIRKETVPIPLDQASSFPPHFLVVAAAKRLSRRGGWQAGTAVRSAPHEVLNLSVTASALDRALRIVDILLKALFKQGVDVKVDVQHGVTLLCWIETGTTFEFAVTEHSSRTPHETTPAEERARRRYWERSQWDTALQPPNIPLYDYTPTGVLTIQVGRSPSRSWRDTPRTKLEQRLGEVTAGIVGVAQETYAREQEQIRRKEAHRNAVAHFEFLTKRRADESERFKQLEASAGNWERAAKLRAFAHAVERRARDAGELTGEQVEWLAWAQAKADWLDPLIPVSDPILDAPEPRRPGYW